MRIAPLALAAMTLLPASAADARKPAETRKAAPVTEVSDTEARIQALESRIMHLESELARRPLDISSYHLPETVELCGQKIRTDDPDIRERLERELYLVLGDREQVVLWTKRARRVFPAIEAEVAKLGTCADVRYLAVIESGLRAGVTSHANAHGYWQFMSPTARDYGLSVDGGWDERADLAASTRAGVKYLADLTRSFDGDWALGMAAYNTGPGRLRNAMEAQGRKDFWRLDLIDEAERYVPRVLAAKIVMSDLQGFGFDLEVADGYAPEPVERITMRLGGRTPTLLETARAVGIDYRTLRRLNPGLTDSDLPSNRTFVLVVPVGKGEAARQLAGREPERTPETRAARVEPMRGSGAAEKGRTHVVQKGDSLGSIAARHKVSVDELRKWNRIGRKEAIRQGQKLIVRR